MKQICKVCNLEKDMHKDFYANTNASGYDTTCSDCRKNQNIKRYRQNKGKPPKHNPHEQNFITACHEHGIYAVQTTEIRNHKYSDVIAWGCVRVEVKYPDILNDGNLYYWRFTNKQARNRHPVDLIVLITECFDGTNYHFFNPNHPVFFNPDKTHKVGFSFTIEREREYHTKYGAIMKEDILLLHKDAWHTIETLRLAKAKELQKQARQIPLWDAA